MTRRAPTNRAVLFAMAMGCLGLIILSVAAVYYGLFFIPEDWGWGWLDSNYGNRRSMTLRRAIALFLGPLVGVYTCAILLRWRYTGKASAPDGLGTIVAAPAIAAAALAPIIFAIEARALAPLRATTLFLLWGGLSLSILTLAAATRTRRRVPHRSGAKL